MTRLVSWIVLAVFAAGGCGGALDRLACEDEACAWDARVWARLQSLTGLGEPPGDPSNRYARDPAAAALGRRLYFDVDFSGPVHGLDALGRPTNATRAPVGQPSRVSCATCHDLGRAGVDVTSVPGHLSVGAGVTDVNALPTVNAAYHKVWFWNGRVDSLWGLNYFVAEAPATMNGSRLQTAHVILAKYAADFEAVFGAELPARWRERVASMPATGGPGSAALNGLTAEDQHLAGQLLALWAKAIAAFEHTLKSRRSPFDRFMREGPSSRALSAEAQRGARLFAGKASCIDCHNGPLLTDGDFHNVGVPQRGAGVPTESECHISGGCDCRPNGQRCTPWGARWGLRVLRDANNQNLRWVNPHSDQREDKDVYREGLRKRPLEPLAGAWRTPSLRDVALTAPYMHNGVFRTLEEVLWHYDTGGAAAAAERVGVPSPRLKPLGLTNGERADLIAFLNALTSPTEALSP